MSVRKMRMMSKKCKILALILMSFWTAGAAGAEELARLQGLEARAVAVEAFELPAVSEIRIEATMPAKSIRFGEAAKAWILDLETRKPVWTLRQEDADESSRSRFEVRDDATLQAGRYELWVSTIPERNWDTPNDSWVDQAARWMFGMEAHEESVAEIDVRVTGAGRGVPEAERKRWRDEGKDLRVVDFTGFGDQGSERWGLELREPVTMSLHAFGEITENGHYDFGWVADADSGEVYWRLDRETSKQAGGADKNRRFDGSLELSAGRYVVAFVSDSSHSAEGWNSQPPWDPESWGLELSLKSPEDRSRVASFDPEQLFEQRTLARLAGDDDDLLREFPFALERDSVLRVHALGEGGSGEMYDYGWIVNDATGERVWSQRYEDSGPAGGVRKNRRTDALLELPEGRYTAYYTTDGSHSVPSWNGAAPADPKRWGLTLLAPVDDFDRSVFRKAQEVESRQSVLAQMQRVGSGSNVSKDFELEKETRLQLVVVGEGTSGRMYDYAWIEERPSGNRVWEMDYSDTVTAGGADKNRLFRGAIRLPAGRYTVHYRTDDSHAFDDWNAAPPSKPDAWGVRVTLAGAL